MAELNGNGVKSVEIKELSEQEQFDQAKNGFDTKTIPSN
jgi:hypothetical protein